MGIPIIGGLFNKVTSIATGGVAGAIGGISDIVSRFKSSDDDRLRATALEMEPLLLQLRTNLAEAGHPSFFVAGARPFVLWVCALGLLWQVIINPLLCWVWAFASLKGVPPPPLNIEVLNTLLFSLLGVGSMRSVDKFNGVDTKKTQSQTVPVCES